MKKILSVSLLGTLLAANVLGAAPASDWVDLLDAKLSKWELFTGLPHVSVRDLPHGTPTSKDITKGTPLGLNNDPKTVFTLQTDSGEPVLYITGEIYAGLTARS